MSARENLSPRFSISHSVPEVFPSREEFRKLGYEPFDVYLAERDSENPLGDPRMFVEGEGTEAFFDGFRDDYHLVFRYRRQDFDVENAYTIPEGIDVIPVFKAEVFPASISPDQDMLALEKLLSNSIDPISEAFYTQALDTRENGRTRRSKDPGHYSQVVSGGEIVLGPETYGLSEVGLQPDSMDALMVVYPDESKAPTEEPSGFRNYSQDSGNDDIYDVEPVYTDEEGINRFEEELRAMGFEVERAHLSPTSDPGDF